MPRGADTPVEMDPARPRNRVTGEEAPDGVRARRQVQIWFKDFANSVGVIISSNTGLKLSPEAMNRW